MSVGIIRRTSVPSRTSWYDKEIPDSTCVFWGDGQNDPQTTLLRDKSHQGNDGTITNIPWAQTSKGLRVLNSAGGAGDFVTQATPTGITGNVACTFECWINLGAIPARSAFMFWGNQAAHQGVFAEVRNNNLWYFHIWDQGTVTTGTPVPAIGAWVHYVGVYDTTNNLIYTQGVFRNSTAYNAANIGNNDMYLFDFSAAVLPTQGQMGLIRFFARALSAEEIRDRFRNTRHLFGV